MVKCWNCVWKHAFQALAQNLRLWYEWQVCCSRACSKAWISPRRLLEASAMRKTVFHESSRSDVWSSGSKGGFVNADKTKARFYSKMTLMVPVPFRYFRYFDFSAGFRPTSALDVARRVLTIAICNAMVEIAKCFSVWRWRRKSDTTLSQ